MMVDRLRGSALRNYTPLRYPGGKAKLAPFIKELIRSNGLSDGEYVEPFAGGAGLAMELLLQEFVSKVYLNDISRPVWSFWRSVLEQTDELVRLIWDTQVSIEVWDKQKAILKNPSQSSFLELGFATFFLNRTNRSGILNGGMIGGRDQTGHWKLDARFNKQELVRRIHAIANMSHGIVLSNLDALQFLQNGIRVWPRKTLIYLDPPYYVKGRSLYLDCYRHEDHERIASLMMTGNARQKWIVSYDNVEPIQSIYAGCMNSCYSLNYSAREAKAGSEVMFYCDQMVVPQLTHAMRDRPSTAA